MAAPEGAGAAQPAHRGREWTGVQHAGTSPTFITEHILPLHLVFKYDIPKHYITVKHNDFSIPESF